MKKNFSRLRIRREDLPLRARISNSDRVSYESTNCFARIDTSTVVKRLSSIVSPRRTVSVGGFQRSRGGRPACTVAVSIFTENFCGFWLDRIASAPRLRVNRCRYIKNNDARIGSQSPLPAPCARKPFRLRNTVERRVPPRRA